jgi:hypothetical protein
VGGGGGPPIVWCFESGGGKIETRFSGEQSDQVEMTFYSNGGWKVDGLGEGGRRR